jgi:hypothetical protein
MSHADDPKKAQPPQNMLAAFENANVIRAEFDFGDIEIAKMLEGRIRVTWYDNPQGTFEDADFRTLEDAASALHSRNHLDGDWQPWI